MVKRLKKNERGIALLAVMVGIALMTIIVVDFATSTQFGFMSAANQVNELRSYYLARSGVSVGLALIAAKDRDAVLNPTPGQAMIDTLGDRWAAPYSPADIDGGKASVVVVDEARKLNINGLLNSDRTVNQLALARMQLLFTILNLSPDLVSAIVQWTGPSGLSSSGMFNVGLVPPRNGPMPTIGDLKMVPGITDAIFNRLRPFLTVVPLGDNRININTAPPEIIASLDPSLAEDTKLVEAIVQERTIRPFQQASDFTVGLDPAVAARIMKLGFNMQSQFFTIRGMGSFAGTRKIIDATFARVGPTGTYGLVSWQED
ncbi:MAG TPA: type II secretion system minor pseudopilin GspK [Candidatus Binataceae bacterium]|nr:type II secretion system minor pseudopilin GspK [Candidatus Binataceae bacterium]